MLYIISDLKTSVIQASPFPFPFYGLGNHSDLETYLPTVIEGESSESDYLMNSRPMLSENLTCMHQLEKGEEVGRCSGEE